MSTQNSEFRTPPHGVENQRHILLVTYGEPPTPAFSDQLVYSWRILLGLTRMVADIPRLLIPLIALYRGFTRSRTWTQEHYSSPLEAITMKQAERLNDMLCRLAPTTDWHVHVAYEFRDPLIADTLKRIPQGASVDIMPMYVADSAFTHEISRATLRDLRDDRVQSGALNARVLPALSEETMAELSAQHVTRELTRRGIETGKDWALVLANHGTLLEPQRPIETGRLGTERICALIADKVSGQFGLVTHGWLNHARGGRWTEPPMDQALADLVEQGVKNAVYFPCGFLTDNAESQLEGRTFLRDQPGLEAVQIDCLNTAPELIEVMAQHVVDHPAAHSSTPQGQQSKRRKELVKG